MSIDLHLHSYFSDGTCSPAELVGLAKKRGITAMSLTDHDTIDGVAGLLEAAELAGVEAIPGIELSVVFADHQLHLLGYCFDHNDKEFRKKIEILQAARSRRNREILGKLEAMGIFISEEELRTVSHTGQTGRPHIAQLLCQKRVVESIDEAFEKYLKNGAKAYASRFVYSAAEAIEMIKKCGGLAVLAHPAKIVRSYKELEVMVGRLADIGLDGLEVFYPGYSANIRKNLKKIAERHDMVLSGGSDYHGLVRPNTQMAGGTNIVVPPDILEAMRKRWRRRLQEIAPGTAGK